MSETLLLTKHDWRQLSQGTDTFDSVCSLEEVYSHLKKDGLMPVFFYDHDHEMSLLEFMEFFYSRADEDLLWLYVVFDKESHVPLGLAFLNNFTGKTAQVHFCFTKAGMGNAYEIASSWLKFVFTHSKLTCLFGLTPFRHAWRFAMSLGFKKTAVLPEACYIGKTDKFKDGVLVIYYKPTEVVV